MKEVAHPKPKHVVYIGLGSNIEPESNMLRALEELKEKAKVICHSSAWQAPALGFHGPDFLNAVVGVETAYTAQDIKSILLHPIEEQLGRKRSADKNAPRTMDLDLLIFDDEILDPHLWDYAHLAVPLAECLPQLKAESHKSITDIAMELQKITPIKRTKLFDLIG